MKIAKKNVYVLVAVLTLFVIPLALLLLSLPQFKAKTHFTPTQINAIQKDFGFTLPEGCSIALCKLTNGRDGIFNIIVTGLKNEEEFIKTNLAFPVEGPFQGMCPSPYAPSKKYEFYLGDEKAISIGYHGKYNGGYRYISIYETNSGTILDLQMSKVVSDDVYYMFPLITW